MAQSKGPRFLKFGGVEFEPLRGPEAVNEFVASLPEEDRQSLQQVVRRLVDEGYIRIPEEPRHSTIDRDYEVLQQKESMKHEEMAARIDEILWQAEDRPGDGI